MELVRDLESLERELNQANEARENLTSTLRDAGAILSSLRLADFPALEITSLTSREAFLPLVEHAKKEVTRLSKELNGLREDRVLLQKRIGMLESQELKSVNQSTRTEVGVHKSMFPTSESETDEESHIYARDQKSSSSISSLRSGPKTVPIERYFELERTCEEQHAQIDLLLSEVSKMMN